MWRSQSCSFGFLCLLTLVFALQRFASIRKFWSCCCLSFHWVSIKLKTACPFWSHSLWLVRSVWDSLLDHLEDVPWKDIFKLSASGTTSEFYEWAQVGIDLPHHKYQVKTHSSPWFSAASTAAIVRRNHFFVCTNKSESKGQFIEASNRCRRVLEAAKLGYANKTK